jgi:hypothetical protein
VEAVTLFGNSLEAQVSRALFQQDLYRRMLDAYQERINKENFQSKKSEEEFWSNYNKLIESISSTKAEIDNFYQKTDLYLFPNKQIARESLTRLEELRKNFLQKYEGIPKGEQATGWAYFANKESRDIKEHLKDDFIPFALNYFKLLSNHLSSLQPFLFIHSCMTETPELATGSLEERYSAVMRSAQFSELENDSVGWDQSWKTYKECQVTLQKTHTEIINSWEPWGERDVEAILRAYEVVVKKSKLAADDFLKKLSKIENKIDKLWEMKKQQEISGKGNSSKEPDTFEKIEKLAKLFELGALTEAEYVAKKAELLKRIK